MFVDRVSLKFIAGKGGNGVVAWRREKYIPKGGPTGGNGGNGGSIYLQSSAELSSLDWFRHRRLIQAKHGADGGANCRQGRNGPSLVLEVPCGTLVKDVRTGETLHDFVEPGERWLLCQGGRGGRGNHSFRSPTNRAPKEFTKGTPGEVHDVELELKLIADVGLVGFPNAGKSTLIHALAGLKIKIAPYPFTTLQPNLGFLTLPDERRIYIADIPGIIEGAHRNRGLGLEFLRHIERTQLLLFVLDASGIDGRNPADDFRVLRSELEAYQQSLLERPFLVVLNKIDTEESVHWVADFRAKYPLPPAQLFEISAAARMGLEPLVNAMAKQVLEGG